MKEFNKSHKLDNVCYDIRGPVMEEAVKMEAQGQRILKLNIGNPAPFGFTAPDEVIRGLMYNLREWEGYSDSKGMFSARKSIMSLLYSLSHASNAFSIAAPIFDRSNSTTCPSLFTT